MDRWRAESFAGLPESEQPTSGGEYQCLASRRNRVVFDLVNESVLQCEIVPLRRLSGKEFRNLIDRSELSAFIDYGGHLLVVRID